MRTSVLVELGHDLSGRTQTKIRTRNSKHSTCQLMQHIVVLIGQLVYFSALHPLQLAIDDGWETVPNGDDGRGGIKCGWRLRAASF